MAPTVQPCSAPEGTNEARCGNCQAQQQKTDGYEGVGDDAAPEPTVRQWCDIRPSAPAARCEGSQPRSPTQPSATLWRDHDPAGYGQAALRQGRQGRKVRTAAGSRPGGWRTSQLRVKLGMMRPPINVISNTMAANANPHAVAAAGVRRSPPDEIRRCRREQRHQSQDLEVAHVASVQ